MIRHVRRAQVTELAHAIGTQPTSYSRFERGERRIYLDKAILLAKRLGVRVDDLTLVMDEEAAVALCAARDREAIAAGTYQPGRTLPPPPVVPSPATAQSGADDTLDEQLRDWQL